MPETVAAIHRVLTRGSSFPSVVETTEGRRYVMKLAGAGPGRRALATELIALKLARHLQLNVPDAQVLDLPRDLPWQAGTGEFYGRCSAAGLNLGIAFIADARDVAAGELASLPEEFLGKLAAVDALLQNVDRTRANPNIMRDDRGVHWAIDFGACLLIDRLARGATEPRRVSPANHFLAGGKNFHIRTRCRRGRSRQNMFDRFSSRSLSRGSRTWASRGRSWCFASSPTSPLCAASSMLAGAWLQFHCGLSGVRAGQ
jgi:hypothetical protein